MKLIRKYTQVNEFPERSGKREILASRFGGTYSLKLIWYTNDKTYIRLYTLTQEEFVSLVTYYGKQIFHSRLNDDYIITHNRSIFRCWIAKQGKDSQVIVRSPNLAEFPIQGNIKRLQHHAQSKVDWRLEIDKDGKRWLVTNFLIHKDNL